MLFVSLSVSKKHGEIFLEGSCLCYACWSQYTCNTRSLNCECDTKRGWVSHSTSSIPATVRSIDGMPGVQSLGLGNTVQLVKLLPVSQDRKETSMGKVGLDEV